MTKAKDISLQAWRRPRHQKREGRAVAAADRGHAWKNPHPGCRVSLQMQSWQPAGFLLYCPTRIFTQWRKEMETILNFSIKNANGELRVLTFRTEAEHKPAPALLKCHVCRALSPVCKCMFWPFSWDHKSHEDLHLWKEKTGFVPKVSFDSD